MKRALILSIGMFGLWGQAFCASITIDNPGFEMDILSDGGASFTISDWVGTGGQLTGVYNPTTFQYNNGVLPSPENAAFIKNNGSIYQVLGQQLTANLTYTLTVEVGWRKDNPTSPNYKVELLTDTDDLLAEDDNTQTRLKGDFVTSTVSYTAPASGSVLGKNLKIRLSATTGTADQANFDDVRLTAIPIPAAAWLFGSGLLGLIGIARRKKAA